MKNKMDNSGFFLRRALLRNLVLMFLLGFFGCDRPKNEIMKEKSQAQPVIVGRALSVNAAAWFIAEERGYFEEEGLDIQFQLYPTGAAALDAVLDDKIHISGAAETPLAFKSLEKDDFQIFATIWTSDNDPKVIVRKSAGIVSPAQLRGRTIGSTQKGQSAHFFLHLFLLRHGFSYDQVTIVHDSPKNIVEKLHKGELVSAVLFEPFVQMAKEKLGEDALVFEEPGLYFKMFNLFAKKNFLSHNQQKIEKILRALSKASKTLNTNPENTVELLQNKFSISERAIRSFLDNSTYDIILTQSLLISMQEQALWAMKNNYIPRREIPDFHQRIFTKALMKVHPEKVTINVN